jgi:coenzyme F420-reducing hydrogenase alpha subunit
MAVGRFLVTHTPEDLAEIRRLATEVKEVSGRLIERLGGQPPKEKRLPFPADHRVNFLTYDSRPGQELFRVFDQTGGVTEEFSRETFEEHVSELRVDWSLAKFPYLTRAGFPDGILLVGPLSRLFQPGGVLDDPELARFALTELLRQPTALSLDDLDTCRLLEIFWAAKQILSHLDEIHLAPLETSPVNLLQSGKGTGVVEAPRGVLVHSYLINQGLMERIGLLVATQFNNAYINLVLKDRAEQHLDGDSLTDEGEELIARCVRTFDPCLTCATH